MYKTVVFTLMCHTEPHYVNECPDTEGDNNEETMIIKVGMMPPYVKHQTSGTH